MRRNVALRTQLLRWHYRRAYSSGVQSHDEPLRILFCGSDEFSIASLRALHDYSQTPQSNVALLEVATRRDKRTGRGNKQLSSPPIKTTAQDLGLKLHQFDTFRGWTSPKCTDSDSPYYNLIVAVSFGLLIPARIINQAKYAGLNVHPSLLPDLRGAAPIDWAIIKGYTHTGVSLQTLHPTKFDHGVVLSQSPKIQISDQVTTKDLIVGLAPLGGKLLVDAIAQKLYLPPGKSVLSDVTTSLTLAPKITPSTRLLDWERDDIATILRKNRAIPRLHSSGTRGNKQNSETVRFILGTEMRQEKPGEISEEIKKSMTIGVPFAITPLNETPSRRGRPIYIMVKDNSILVVPQVLIADAAKMKPASQACKSADLFAPGIDIGDHTVHSFWSALATTMTHH